MTTVNRVVSGELRKTAENELNEIPGRTAEDISHIREWLSQEPHLKHIKADDQLILSFLRGCKFSLQRTKEKLDLYYSMKSLLPEIYDNRDPFLPEIQQLLSGGPYLPLLKTAGAAEPRIIVMRVTPDDPAKVLVANVWKTCFMIIDILLKEDDNFVIAGLQAFVDLKVMSAKHAMYLDLNLVKKCIICIQSAYAVRPKGIHVINTPSFYEMLFNILKPYFAEKIRNRIKVYSQGNINDMFNVIPLSVLPKEYGGEGSSLDELTAYWKRKVESYRDWFLEDSKNCSDETKRRGSPRNSTDIFGIEGSFRKLEVD